MILLAIDPGSSESAYCVIETTDYSIIDFGKVPNEVILADAKEKYYDAVAIEMVSSFGMPVGKEVFDTVLVVGRLMQIAYDREIEPELVYRKDVKLNLCGSTRAKDSNIIQALKDRFGDKGTTKNKGWFFGFSKDVWQSYATGATWIDRKGR